MSDGIYTEVSQEGGQCAPPFNRLPPSACEQPVAVAVAGRRVDRAKVPAVADLPAVKGTPASFRRGGPDYLTCQGAFVTPEPVWPGDKGLETDI